MYPVMKSNERLQELDDRFAEVLKEFPEDLSNKELADFALCLFVDFASEHIKENGGPKLNKTATFIEIWDSFGCY
jgi:hypothetical protein